MAESLSQLRSRYRWDSQSLRFRGPSGKFVSLKAVKQSLNSFVRRAKREQAGYDRQMLNGTLPLDEWRRLKANGIKSIHLAMQAAARGGWQNLTQSDYGRTGALLRFHYAKLDRFTRQIAEGRLPRGTILQRSAMYADAGASTYENERRDVASDVFTEEKRILGASEHCPTCRVEADRGWQPIGTLRKIGDSECLVSCRCRFAFRTR